jgi:hypothetical protein
MNAVDATRRFYHKNIALFAEVPVEHPDLPDVGHIGGNFDFLVAGDADMHEDAKYALPERPYFIVVEAKKSTTLGPAFIEGSTSGQASNFGIFG